MVLNSEEEKVIKKFIKEIINKEIKELTKVYDNIMKYDISVNDFTTLKIKLNFLKEMKDYIFINTYTNLEEEED